MLKKQQAMAQNCCTAGTSREEEEEEGGVGGGGGGGGGGDGHWGRHAMVSIKNVTYWAARWQVSHVEEAASDGTRLVHRWHLNWPPGPSLDPCKKDVRLAKKHLMMALRSTSLIK